MKKWELKKNIALMLCLVMVMSMLNPFFALAEEPEILQELYLEEETLTEEIHEVDIEEKSVTESIYGTSVESDAINVHLTIEGIDNIILEKTLVQITHGEKQPTALDVLEKALKGEGVSYELIDYGWSIMVVNINGDAAGTFGGYDGWMYRVNNFSPDVGASSYKVNDEDDIYFYYNRWPALSSQTKIEKDITDPTLIITLAGDQFTADANNVVNWSIDTGTTELETDGIVINDDTAIIKLTGSANSGVISVTAKEKALGGTGSSNKIQFFINEKIAFESENHEWVVNGQTVLDALLKYQQPDGSFQWTLGSPGGNKFATVDAIDALVNLSLGTSNKHQTGTSPTFQTHNIQLSRALDKTVDWYQKNHPAPQHWSGITALKNAGQNLNSDPWNDTQSWRDYVPGLLENATGNDLIHTIFRLLAVDKNPENWGGINLYDKLLKRQNNDGAFGDLGTQIWAIVALDTGKNLGSIGEEWNLQKQSAALNVLIGQQNHDGSFGPFSELDFSGWALVALSQYRGDELDLDGDRVNIDDVIGRATSFLKSRQKSNAGFDMEGEWGAENANTNAAVIAGLAAIGQNLLPDETEIEIKSDTVPFEIMLDKNSAMTFLRTNTIKENGNLITTLPFMSVQADSVQGIFTLDIPQATRITGPLDWDGTIQLPRRLDPSSIHMSQGTVLAAVQVGYPGGSLTFDKAVRIKLPGQAGKNVGFIQSGQFHEITEVLWSDNADWMESTAGKYDLNGDLVIWTTHFTTFVTYDKMTTPPPSGGIGGGGAPGAESRASLAVRGHQGRTFLPTTDSTINSNETVLSFTRRILDERGISYDISGEYVRAINGLAELDHGPGSGWMFSVNGSYPQTGASFTPVRSNDQIEWRYTLDLGDDLGAGPGANQPLGAGQSVHLTDLKEAQRKAIKWILNNRNFSPHDNFADWDALALTRYGETVPKSYWLSLENHLNETGGTFRLVTDYARIILATTALGIHAEDVFGHNLLNTMLNHENMLLQGVNGPAHALLALDAYAYDGPLDAVWSREKLITEIVRLQKRHGGYSLSERSDASGDIDLTAMVLQALAPYQQRTDAKRASDKAIKWLMQQRFDNSESISQTIIAFSSLGLDIAEQSFERMERSLVKELMSYQQQDGGFAHRQNSASGDIATQQALMALTAYQLYLDQKNAFFDMRDVDLEGSTAEKGIMDDEDHIELEKMNLADENEISPWALDWVKKAVAYGLMSGVSTEELRFDPKRELTRAEFAALMAKIHGAGMSNDETPVFQDVQPGSWYFGHVMTARRNGWMSGVSEDSFAPHRSISRQEMAVVLAKALALTPNMAMAQPADLDDAADWSKTPVRLVYHHRLMVGDGQLFMPGNAVTREMAAVIMVKLYEDHLSADR